MGISLGTTALADAVRNHYDSRDLLQRSARGPGFAPLPGTRREVEVLVSLFPERKILLGSDASEQQLDALARAGELTHYRYLHLATHGQADAASGLRSFLALADDHLPDPLTILPPGQKLYRGRLSAGDMRAWKLDAELVTLSACETGLGEKQLGEGYVGFAHALLLAGSRTLVLSQWKVDDTATALLMQRFYQNLLGKREGLNNQALGKAAALAEAKRWLRGLSSDDLQRLVKELPPVSRGSVGTLTGRLESAHPYEHPYYWSGFILIGDPGDVRQAVPVLADASPMSPTAATTGPASSEAAWWPWLIGMAIVGAGGGFWLFRRARRSTAL
jgi:CHAT domain-containing protein